MANSFGTYVDVVKYRTPNGDMPTDVHVGGQFITAVGIMPISGTVYQYERRTANPNVAFRAVGAGKDYSPGTSESVTHTLKFLDGSVFTDAARIRNLPREQVIADDIRAANRQSLYEIDQAIFAESVVTGGFTPLAAIIDSSMVFDGGGTGTDGCTSAYLIRVGEDGVTPLAGNDGVIAIGESVASTLNDGSSKPVGGYLTLIDGYIGLAIHSTYAACRIANLTAADQLSDDLLYAAWALFPASFKPTHLVLNSGAIEGLRQSRTATNPTGAPAPLPETVIDGKCRVIVCDGISSTEDSVA